MPPKAKFTKEEVIRAASAIVRREGLTGLTARALGKELNSSACPIFTLFKGMEEVENEVIAYANERYQSYLREDMQKGTYPPYKASGMAYIRFAKEERELFKLLFMRDRTGEKVEEDRESIRPLLDVLQKNLGLSEDDAYLFHLEMWVFVHGIAVMLATSYLEWDIDFISRALSDVYAGLCAGVLSGGKNASN